MDFAEVVRYWERKGTTVDEVIARLTASPTPEAVKCFTVVSSPITPPDDLATPEYILRIIRGYIIASFDSGIWVKTAPQPKCYSIKGGKDVNHAIQFSNICYLAGTLLLRQNFDEAENTFSAASAISRKMLLAERPDTIDAILHRVAGMQSNDLHEMPLPILRQLSVRSKELLGESHPLCLLTAWLATMVGAQIESIISKCFEVMIDYFESLVGPMHQSTLSFHLTLNEMDPNPAILRRLLNQCESALGSYDERTLIVRVELMACTWTKGNYAEAMRIAEDLLTVIQNTEAIVESIWYQSEAYIWIAHCHYSLGELDSAVANLQAAINLSLTHFGSRYPSVTIWLLTLEQWSIEQGDLIAAMVARDQRISILVLTERA